MLSLANHVEREFGSSVNDFLAASYVQDTADGRYSVELSVPGYTKSDLTITVADDRSLEVAGETSTKKRGTQRFRQSVLLPEDADLDDIAASVSDGILSIDIGKKAPPKINTRTIAIA
jgi:HSP20 family protein